MTETCEGCAGALAENARLKAALRRLEAAAFEYRLRSGPSLLARQTPERYAAACDALGSVRAAALELLDGPRERRAEP